MLGPSKVLFSFSIYSRIGRGDNILLQKYFLGSLEDFGALSSIPPLYREKEMLYD